MVMYENETKTTESKNWAKDKIQPQYNVVDVVEVT